MQNEKNHIIFYSFLNFIKCHKSWLYFPAFSIGEIQLPAKVDPFASVDIDHETTSQRLRTLGLASSSSRDSTLTCINRKSGVSAVGDDKFVDVRCQDGEVLTGCSSLMVVGSSFHISLHFLYFVWEFH